MLTFASANIYKTNIKMLSPYQFQARNFWYSFPLDIIYGDTSKQTLQKLIIYSKLGFDSSSSYRTINQANELLETLIKNDPTLKKDKI